MSSPYVMIVAWTSRLPGASRGEEGHTNANAS